MTRGDLPREEAFLLAATHPLPDDASADAVNTFALEALHPDRLLQVAMQNNVVPLACRHIERVLEVRGGAKAVWTSFLRRGAQLRRTAAGRHLETLALLGKLEAAGIDAAPLKGTVLSERLYGDATLKQSGDIDLLVRPVDLHRAVREIQAIGFELLRPSALPDPADMPSLFARFRGHHIELIKRSLGLRLEIHWTLRSVHDWPSAEPEPVWASFARGDCQGVTIRQMSSDEAILYLAAHGVRHRWYSLSWLADFARMWALTRGKAGDIASLAATRNLSVATAAACNTAAAWYGLERPQWDLSRAQMTRARWLSMRAELFVGKPRRSRKYEWMQQDSLRGSVAVLAAHFLFPGANQVRRADEFGAPAREQGRWALRSLAVRIAALRGKPRRSNVR